MPRVRTIQPFVCLLLVVTTAVCTVMTPVRTCGCTLRQTKPTVPPPSAAPVPEAGPSRCCPCCPSASGTIKVNCCCRELSSTPVPEKARSGQAECQCERCEGGRPVNVPEAPPVGPGDTNDYFNALAESLSTPASALFVLDNNRAEHPSPVDPHSPTDLDFVLSRLTC
jgi:hypothetical protein